MRTFRLVIACPDGVGIVAKVSNFLASHNGWITEASHHSDDQSGWFFMRHEIRADSLPFGLEAFREAFAPIAEEFSMEWRITDTAQKKRVVLMASRESHCLADLLHRWHSDELDCDISCVISNHDDLRSRLDYDQLPAAARRHGSTAALAVGAGAIAYLAWMALRTPPRPASVQPVGNFDVSRYLGRWYEVARIDQRFEKGLVRTRAEYSLAPNGSVQVVNRGFDPNC